MKSGLNLSKKYVLIYEKTVNPLLYGAYSPATASISNSISVQPLGQKMPAFSLVVAYSGKMTFNACWQCGHCTGLPLNTRLMRFFCSLNDVNVVWLSAAKGLVVVMFGHLLGVIESM